MTDRQAALLKVRYAMRIRRELLGKPTPVQADLEQQASGHQIAPATYLELQRNGLIDRGPVFSLTSAGHAALLAFDAPPAPLPTRYPSRVSPTAAHRAGRAFARIEVAQMLLRELRTDLRIIGETSHLGHMPATFAVARAAERELHVLRDHLISIVETFACEEIGQSFGDRCGAQYPGYTDSPTGTRCTLPAGHEGGHKSD